ncbi:MAG: hypothetical protein R8G66_24610 [Cytophagales bacterium]|nr:hypothetical protein [Cytophagales bacterium]
MTKQSLILMLCLTYSLLNYGQQVIGVSDLNPKLQIRGFIQLVAYAEDSLYIGGNVGFINDRISNPIVKVSLDGQLSESFNFDMPFSSDLFNELFQPHVLWNNRLHIQYQGEVRRINENGSFDDSFVINDAPNVQMLITHRDSLLILSNGERLALYGDDGDERIISDINTEEFGLQWLYQLDESSFLIETRERSTDNLQLRLFTNGQLDDSFEPINFTRPGAPANAERLANGEILIYGNEIVLGETQGNGIYILSADGSLSSNSPHEADLSFIDAYDNSIEIVTSDGNGKLFILGHNDPNSFANLGLAKMSLTGRRDDEFQIRSMTVEFGTRDLIPAGTGRFLLAVNQSSYDGQPSRGLNLIDIDGNAIEAFNVKTGGLPFTITSFRKINDDEFLIEGPFESSEPDGQAYLTKFSPTDGPKSTDLGFTLGVENGLGASKFLENGDFMVGFQEENTNYLKVFRDGESVEVSAQIFEPFVQRSLRSIVQTEEGIYASGSIGYNVSDTNQYGIIKLDSDYNRDETFTSPFREDEIVENVFAQDDNRLVVQTSCFNESQYKVIRLMPDGTKDETFSDIISNGASTPPVFSFSDSLFMTYDVDFNEDQRINIHDKNGEMVNQDLFRIDADRNIGDIQMISDSTFLISGNFRFVNGIPRRGIAILGTNGALYDDLDLDVVGNVSQI